MFVFVWVSVCKSESGESANIEETDYMMRSEMEKDERGETVGIKKCVLSEFV